MKNESGRSMVEMLGVLAIIGVLSIGGIAGYTLAMNRYRANEIMDTAAKLAIVSLSANGGKGGTATLTDLGMESIPGADLVKAENGVVQITNMSEAVAKLVDEMTEKYTKKDNTSGNFDFN